MACASPTHAVRLSYLEHALSRAGASAPVPIRPSPSSSLTNSPSRAAASAKFPWGVSPGATDGLSPPGPTIRPAPQLTPEESERKVRGWEADWHLVRPRRRGARRADRPQIPVAPRLARADPLAQRRVRLAPAANSPM